MGKNGSRKKLSYTISKNGLGKVTMKGLLESEGEIVSDALNSYGYSEDPEKDAWVDAAAPVDDAFEESISVIKNIAPFSLRSEITARGNIQYFAKIDQSKEVMDKSIHGAFEKAHKAWNRDGRPVRGVRVTTALDRAVHQIQDLRA